MSEQSQWSQDLHYVRGLVDHAAQPHLPRAVILIWAIIVLIGFPLPDFVAQGTVLRYWMIAGPIGFLLCALSGARAMRQSGQHDVRAARRQLAHWGALFLTGGLALLLPQTGNLDWQGIAPLMLLLVSFAYLLAGIHLEPYLAGPGVAFALGYCLLVYRVPFAWTIVGVLAALAFVISTEIGRRNRVAAAG
jgi:hypothetical protein